MRNKTCMVIIMEGVDICSYCLPTDLAALLFMTQGEGYPTSKSQSQKIFIIFNLAASYFDRPFTTNLYVQYRNLYNLQHFVR